MCDKNNLAVGTKKMNKMILFAWALEVFLMFFLFYNIKFMLDFYSSKHSTTEWAMRSFGLIATCHMETSSVQGVHHAGVAVELGHLLKNKRLDLVLLPMLLYNFTYITNCNLRLVSGSKKTSLAMVSEAVKMMNSLVKCMGMLITSLSNSLETSLAKILCHRSGSYGRQMVLKGAVDGDEQVGQGDLQEDAEHKLFFVGGVLQPYLHVFVFWLAESFLCRTVAESFLLY